MTKKLYYYLNVSDVDLENLPSVKEIEDHLGVVLVHGDIVNFGDDRFGHAYFVREMTNRRVEKIREWFPNPDISCSGYLTVPSEITACMDDAIKEYSKVMRTLDNSFTAIYLSEDDVYLQRYPSIRRIEEHTWFHKGRMTETTRMR